MALAIEAIAVLATAAALGWLAGRLGLPPLLGMIIGGATIAALAPTGDQAGPTLNDVASPTRMAILALVLLRAGVGLSIKELRGAGTLGIRLGLLPLGGDALLLSASAWLLLDLAPLPAIVLGTLVAAISPAIVIPGLLLLLDSHSGRARRPLTALLVGAPIDNIVALLAFGVALDLAVASDAAWTAQLAWLPLRLTAAVALGVAGGWSLARALGAGTNLNRPYAAVPIWLLAAALAWAGRALDLPVVVVVIVMGATLRAWNPDAATRLGDGLRQTWTVVQVGLFGLIGYAVDLEPLARVGLLALAVIALGQVGRAAGSALATRRSGLNRNERLASALCYVPKATLQAAFGAMALDRGLAAGEVILGTAVLAIAVTAPIGVVTLHRVADGLFRRADDSNAGST